MATRDGDSAVKMSLEGELDLYSLSRGRQQFTQMGS